MDFLKTFKEYFKDKDNFEKEVYCEEFLQKF